MLRGHGFPMPRELFICLQAAADEALGMGFDVFFWCSRLDDVQKYHFG